MSFRAGVVGARGYVGAELARLIDAHPQIDLAYVASGASAGKPVSDIAPGVTSALTVVAPDPDGAAGCSLDVCFLSAPNGASAPYVEAFARAAPDVVLIDISADHRFDDDWAYGLPEHHRETLRGARRIANPGCFATAVQLAIAPFASLLSGPAAAFGVSGYSGAGSTPSPRNDVERLRDSVMPYAPAGHGHEAEIRRHLGGRAVNFSPHVAGFFRGLEATVQFGLAETLSQDDAQARLVDAYAGEPLVKVVEASPEIADIREKPGAIVGGVVAVPDERRLVLACAIDNLLKGAASQAVQNANLALGLEETAGLLSA